MVKRGANPAPRVTSSRERSQMPGRVTSDLAMSSLKHLLQDDVTDAPEPGFYGGGASRARPFQGDLPDSDTPVLTDRSWDGWWGDLLCPELPSGDPLLDDNGNKGSDATFANIEDIELWAEQSLPVYDPPSDTVPLPLPALPGDQRLDAVLQQCYGMIYRASVKVVGNMADVDMKLKTTNGSNDCYAFNICKSLTQIVLKFQDNVEFGYLNTHISKVLEPLLTKPLVQLEVLGSQSAILEVIGRATKAADAIVRVNINIYGPQDVADVRKEVARHLSDQKIYLQRPDSPKLGSVYDNPHVLKFSDIDISSFDFKAKVAPPRAEVSTDPKKLQKIVDNVYASLTRGSKLNRMEGDSRVETKLLPHQQEALDFMVQREVGPIPLEFCLWKPMEGDNKDWYIHAVTGAKSRLHHVETGGGILADEMGMGKTLSILALITKTFDSADKWVAPLDILSDNQREQRRSRATLVIVPSAVLINEWLNEIDIHLNGSLKILKYHGARRKELEPTLEKADIVLTTYHTLVVDYDKRLKPLHRIEWFRVVLDEAHIIRRHATTFNRATSELKAGNRWCLTGTPIQNKLEDFGALIAFIRASPFHNLAMFRRFVTTPFDESEERRAVATRNLTLLLESLCLRRGRDLLHLPDPKERVILLDFSKAERDLYKDTVDKMDRALRHKPGETRSTRMFGLFQIQLQLRILCNHGTYQHPLSWKRQSLLDEREAQLCQVGIDREVVCSVCCQPISLLNANRAYQRVGGNCAHVLCSDCLEESEELNEGVGDEVMSCPLCALSGAHVPGSRLGARTGDHDDGYLRPEGHSSKIEALVSDIKEDLWKSKSIVFSCWTHTLNLIERYFEKESIPYLRVDGDCPTVRRQKVLDDFSNKPENPILIMTTGTGAFGLNLTSANRVFIIEPQWNPSVENQAISRAIRMKQKEHVLVTRYMIRGTVEQEMRSQQERKLKIAELGNSQST